MNSGGKFFVVALVLLLLSAGLLYKGIEEEVYKYQLLKQQQEKQEEEKSKNAEVLGDSLKEGSESAEIKDSYLVTKVVDGDTIEIEDNGNLKRVRLIGIDTPETVDPNRPKGCFGSEASNETKRLLNGKRVYLEKDVSETDKYQRILRYVYLPLDNGKQLFINDYLIREGFGQVLTYPPDVKYNEQFLEAQKIAKEQQKGLWGKCAN